MRCLAAVPLPPGGEENRCGAAPLSSDSPSLLSRPPPPQIRRFAPFAHPSSSSGLGAGGSHSPVACLSMDSRGEWVAAAGDDGTAAVLDVAGGGVAEVVRYKARASPRAGEGEGLS